MILVGDVGGTHVRVGFAHITGGRVRIEQQRVYHSKAFAGLKEILGSFLQGCAERIDAACLGVAGPVEGMRCATTNLPWIIDGEELLQSLPFPSVHLLNDLEATAYGILTLDPTDLVVLNPGGKHRAGNKAVIAAGTGLGEAGLYWDGSTHHPFATEGGHSDFAPRTHREWRLLRYLQQWYEHVSVERVVSGPGIEDIYKFLHHETGTHFPEWFESLGNLSDHSAAIADHALDNADTFCIEALQMFVSLYGAEAGNLALKVMARDGLYMAGGIAPKVLTSINNQIFVEAFLAKGRMRALLEEIPVYLVQQGACPLLGAASFAARAKSRRQ